MRLPLFSFELALQPLGFFIDFELLQPGPAFFLFQHLFDALGLGVLGVAAVAFFPFDFFLESGALGVDFPLRTGVCWGRTRVDGLDLERRPWMRWLGRRLGRWSIGT